MPVQGRARFVAGSHGSRTRATPWSAGDGPAFSSAGPLRAASDQSYRIGDVVRDLVSTPVSRLWGRRTENKRSQAYRSDAGKDVRSPLEHGGNALGSGPGTPAPRQSRAAGSPATPRWPPAHWARMRPSYRPVPGDRLLAHASRDRRPTNLRSHVIASSSALNSLVGWTGAEKARNRLPSKRMADGGINTAIARIGLEPSFDA